MVLGLDWLKRYGRVTFDYANSTVVLVIDDQQLLLKGLIEGSKLKMLAAKEWYQECQKGACCAVGYIMQIGETKELEVPQVIQEVLQLYGDVLKEEPKGLLPIRS